MDGSILIIDDDEAIRETFQLILETEGYSVFTAANGKEGLEVLSKMPSPCLILLDLMMPVMDGWAFAEAHDKEKRFSKIPIVVVTAFPEMTAPLKNTEGVMKKPVDIDLLIRTVAQYCERI